MFIKLPSAAKKYRGKYPKRISQHSRNNGTVWFELNDGSRYVARNLIFTPKALRLNSFLNKEVDDLVCNADRADYEAAELIDIVDYVGILIANRLALKLRGLSLRL